MNNERRVCALKTAVAICCCSSFVIIAQKTQLFFVGFDGRIIGSLGHPSVAGFDDGASPLFTHITAVAADRDAVIVADYGRIRIVSRPPVLARHLEVVGKLLKTLQEDTSCEEAIAVHEEFKVYCENWIAECGGGAVQGPSGCASRATLVSMMRWLPMLHALREALARNFPDVLAKFRWAAFTTLLIEHFFGFMALDSYAGLTRPLVEFLQRRMRCMLQYALCAGAVRDSSEYLAVNTGETAVPIPMRTEKRKRRRDSSDDEGSAVPAGLTAIGQKMTELLNLLRAETQNRLRITARDSTGVDTGGGRLVKFHTGQATRYDQPKADKVADGMFGIGRTNRRHGCVRIGIVCSAGQMLRLLDAVEGMAEWVVSDQCLAARIIAVFPGPPVLGTTRTGTEITIPPEVMEAYEQARAAVPDVVAEVQPDPDESEELEEVAEPVAERTKTKSGRSSKPAKDKDYVYTRPARRVRVNPPAEESAPGTAESMDES